MGWQFHPPSQVLQTLPRYGQIELGERILLFSKSYIKSTWVLVNAESKYLDTNAISV